MQLFLLDEARRQVEYEDAWWRAHRDAVDLFIDELERTLESLRAGPEIGQAYRRSRDGIIQRWLMPKTRCHIYYLVRRDREPPAPPTPPPASSPAPAAAASPPAPRSDPAAAAAARR